MKVGVGKGFGFKFCARSAGAKTSASMSAMGKTLQGRTRPAGTTFGFMVIFRHIIAQISPKRT